MDRRSRHVSWGISFRLASIFCAICLGFTRANASASYEENLGEKIKISVPPLWEAVRPESKAWTTYSAQVVDDLGDDLLAGSKDIESFCPTYYKLNRNQKITTWVFLVSAIVRYESNFGPTDRYEESGLGKDEITHQPVYSEGLLALSYQDVLKYPFCDEFDWHADKHLKPNDPKKSILSPFKNLKCGIQILNYLVHKYDNVGIDEGAYWSTVSPHSKHSRLDKMKALVKDISICKKQ